MTEHAREPKLNEFPPASYEDWLALVERDLKGASFEKKLVKRVSGIDVAPLYTRAEGAAGLPGCPPFTRGSHTLGAVETGWDVRARIADSELSQAAQSIDEALRGGAHSVYLCFDEATRAGNSKVGHDGIACLRLADLQLLLEPVALDKTPVAFDAGVNSLPLASMLLAHAQSRGIDARSLSGSLGADPLGCLARYGSLPGSLPSALRELVELARYTHEYAPHLSSVAVDAAAYHEAGADAATELALALATGLSYLRTLTEAGMEVSAAAKQLVFRFAVGRDFFLEIAKLRAARTCWSRIVSASGGDASAQAMLIHASTSRRTKTRHDPWVNLLRATTESFSAAIGGADAITTGCFDEMVGASDEFARHLARNTQHILRDEAHLHRVIDAPGGSYYLESLTHELAHHAWAKLQDLEKRGPFSALIVDGSLQRQLAATLEAEATAVATRKIAITGISEFPHVREDKLDRPTADLEAIAQRALTASERGGVLRDALAVTPSVQDAMQLFQGGAALHAFRAAWSEADRATAPRLTRKSLAAPFEELRDAADRAAAKGKRPRVFLANLASIPEHKARAQFAQNFFEAGGFEALTNDGFPTAAAAASAFSTSGAALCAICSSDSVYESLAVDTARMVQASAPQAIVLAGNPGEHEARYREAGITDFVYTGMNLVEALRSLLARAGVV